MDGSVAGAGQFVASQILGLARHAQLRARAAGHPRLDPHPRRRRALDQAAGDRPDRPGVARRHRRPGADRRPRLRHVPPRPASCSRSWSGVGVWIGLEIIERLGIGTFRYQVTAAVAASGACSSSRSSATSWGSFRLLLILGIAGPVPRRGRGGRLRRRQPDRQRSRRDPRVARACSTSTRRCSSRRSSCSASSASSGCSPPRRSSRSCATSRATLAGRLGDPPMPADVLPGERAPVTRVDRGDACRRSTGRRTAPARSTADAARRAGRPARRRPPLRGAPPRDRRSRRAVPPPRDAADAEAGPIRPDHRGRRRARRRGRGARAADAYGPRPGRRPDPPPAADQPGLDPDRDRPRRIGPAPAAGRRAAGGHHRGRDRRPDRRLDLAPVHPDPAGLGRPRRPERAGSTPSRSRASTGSARSSP